MVQLAVGQRIVSEPMDSAGDMIQIRLGLDHDTWHGVGSEGIWVRLVKPMANQAIVEVDNIPFFTKSLSLKDRISVGLGQNGPVLNSIVERGGHSTYRIFIQHQTDEAVEMLNSIKMKGCEWEATKFRGGDLYALDIPPHVNIRVVYEILKKGQTDGIWLFEEGYVGHPLEDDPAPSAS